MDPTLLVISIFVVYGIFVVLMYKRILPMVWAMAIFAILMALMAGSPWESYVKIATTGTLTFADFNFTVVLGTMFAAALLETGIVDSMVRRAIELGGGRPLATAIVIFLVWTYVGIGVPIAGAVMVGSIVLPVQVALGFSPVVVATFHTLGAAAGQPFWLAHWVYFRSLTGVYFGDYIPMAMTMTAVTVVFGLFYIVYQTKREKLPFRSATEKVSPSQSTKRVPVYSFITPIIPLIFAIGLKIDPKFAFMLSIPFPFILTQQGSGRGVRDLYGLLERSAYKGVTLLAELIAIMVFVGWVVVAAGLPEINQPLTAVFKPIMPTNPLFFVLFFAVLMPFCMFRGPTAPWGIGAALAIVWSHAGVLPALTILGVIYAYNLFMGFCEPTWGVNIWTTTYLKVNSLEFTRKCILWAFILGVILLVIVAIQWLPH
jgi:H+/gluconate symporter-like permease